MKVIVEKVSQSPSTPVTELTYLVQFTGEDVEDYYKQLTDDDKLLYNLERRTVERLKKLGIINEIDYGEDE